MGQWYPYCKKWDKNIVVILHSYGSTAILLIFCDHQDTESELFEIEMSTSEPIFVLGKQIKIYKTTIYKTYKIGENIVAILHIYRAS